MSNVIKFPGNFKPRVIEVLYIPLDGDFSPSHTIGLEIDLQKREDGLIKDAKRLLHDKFLSDIISAPSDEEMLNMTTEDWDVIWAEELPIVVERLRRLVLISQGYPSNINVHASTRTLTCRPSDEEMLKIQAKIKKANPKILGSV
jgi:hypothetical protein